MLKKSINELSIYSKKALDFIIVELDVKHNEIVCYYLNIKSDDENYVLSK